MGRIKHTHKTTSVIILIIDENRIFAFECKCESPITADIYRPVAIEFTSQLMQTPPWSVHIFSHPRIVQSK